MTPKILFLDFGMIDSCNLSCDYCRDSPQPPKEGQLTKAFEGLKIVLKHTDPAIIKSSGYGELTLFKEFSKLLLPGSQLITNGTYLTEEKIKELSQIQDFSICFSIDGHNYDLNKARFKSVGTLEIVLKNLKITLDNRIPTEINCVLTRYNTGKFHLFLDYLSRFQNQPLVFPFPVRPFPGKRNDWLFPTKEDIEEFEEHIVKDYAHYSQLLPAPSYLDGLISFLKKGKRLTVCYVPSVITGIDPAGNILLCPCGPEEKSGNIFENGRELENHPYVETGHWEQCNSCFNHYEIINLYLRGKVSREEVKRVPSLRSEKAIRLLEEKK
jgi:sulfatase maturation enzyme AslB (radical SAM superfamily)